MDAPSVEITIQDLYDTCKYLEFQANAMDDDILIDAAGKENLGGGVYVGMTATLNNALLAFEARPGATYVQCRVNGGNLVAVDDVGAYFATPISPTAFTQVVTTASSSATTQSQAQLEHSTFSGGVTVDVVNGVSGTVYPIGTPSNPVDNIPDAVAIASSRGFDTLYIIGNITLDTGDNVSNFTLIGQNATRTTITVNAGADTIGCEIQEAYVTGNLDGGTILRNCVIDSLNYINGFVYKCMLNAGTISLGGSTTAHFLDCYSGVPGNSTPELDCNGVSNTDDTPLALRNYSGGILLKDLNHGGAVSIDLVSGQVKIDHTCTNGTIIIRGNGRVTYNTAAQPTVWKHMLTGTYNGNLYVDNDLTYGEHVHDIWMTMGLDQDNPVTTTPTSRVTGNITQVISGDGETTSTITRL